MRQHLVWILLLLAVLVGVRGFRHTSKAKNNIIQSADRNVAAVAPVKPAVPAAPPSGAAPVATTAPTPRGLARKEIERLDACFESEKCNFPQTDPRSYYFGVGKALSAQLKDFYNKNKDDSA